MREELGDKGGRELRQRRSAQGAWALLRARGRLCPKGSRRLKEKERRQESFDPSALSGSGALGGGLPGGVLGKHGWGLRGLEQVHVQSPAALPSSSQASHPRRRAAATLSLQAPAMMVAVSQTPFNPGGTG